MVLLMLRTTADASVAEIRGVEMTGTEINGELRGDGGGLNMKNCSFNECVREIGDR